MNSVKMDIGKLHPFEGHPFKVQDNEEMDALVESIQSQGILTPLIVRKKENTTDEYEIISGHRRYRAAMKAGLETVPAFIYALDRNAAAIMLVDCNLHRERLLPSEKAFAYKMKLDAMKHQGKRLEVDSSQVGTKRSDQVLAEQVGQSRNQIQRYVRLTELIAPLLDMVDEKKIAINPAYEISFLTKKEQEMLLETIDYEQATPSLSQAQRMKKMSQEGTLNEDTMLSIMSEQKKPELDKVSFSSDTLRKYFPRSYTPQRMQETIIKLLEQWQKKRQQQQER